MGKEAVHNTQEKWRSRKQIMRDECHKSLFSEFELDGKYYFSSSCM